MAQEDLARGTPQLAPLSELDGFKVAEGDPDIRGWDVLAADGTKVGEVEDLLVDTAQMRVRYLDVELDDDRFGVDDRHVLLPIGQARLDDDDDNVLVDIDADAFASLPPYTRGTFSREYETTLRQSFSGGAPVPAGATDADYYAHRDFDESRFLGSRRRGTEGEGALRVTRSEEELALGKRAVEAGEATVRKTVETERVRESVPLTREEVEIERRPIDPGMAAGDVEIGEDEIRVPLMEEQVVAEKRVVPKEEVVVKKRAVEETQEVEAELKKERIDADGSATRRRSERKRDDEERAR